MLFTTARKFKGLEADVVIIVDIDENTFATDESRRLFYVGASRAKHNLDIVFIGSNEDLRRLALSISEEKYRTPLMGIARCLNVKPEIKK